MSVFNPELAYIANLDLRNGFKHLNYRDLPKRYIESESLTEFLIEYFEHNKEALLKLGLQEINPDPFINEVFIWRPNVIDANILEISP